MEISPDATVIWSWGPLYLNVTLVFTWAVMALLIACSWLATRSLKVEQLGRWQNFFEALIGFMQNHIRHVIGPNTERYLPFLGTLFLFISFSNLLIVIPGSHPPTGSLSTTAALAVCVFFAVPLYSIAEHGVHGYLRHYVKPSVLMLPLHIMEELTRTLTLAVRLFGSIMSETMIAAALLAIVPFFVPVIMKLFGLLIGQIQAYIFAVLASIYIASAVSAGAKRNHANLKEGSHG